MIHEPYSVHIQLKKNWTPQNRIGYDQSAAPSSLYWIVNWIWSILYSITTLIQFDSVRDKLDQTADFTTNNGDSLLELRVENGIASKHAGFNMTQCDKMNQHNGTVDVTTQSAT